MKGNSMWYNDKRSVDFSELKGLVVSEIQGMVVDGEHVTIKTECGRTFLMYHYRDCCESVYICDVVGDVSDLIGTPILQAEETTQDDPEAYEAGMWTFYKLATIKGYVDLRWYGKSNGHYSISVSLEEVLNESNE